MRGRAREQRLIAPPPDAPGCGADGGAGASQTWARSEDGDVAEPERASTGTGGGPVERLTRDPVDVMAPPPPAAATGWHLCFRAGA
jgi:hypothetical protein